MASDALKALLITCCWHLAVVLGVQSECPPWPKGISMLPKATEPFHFQKRFLFQKAGFSLWSRHLAWTPPEHGIAHVQWFQSGGNNTSCCPDKGVVLARGGGGAMVTRSEMKLRS